MLVQKSLKDIKKNKRSGKFFRSSIDNRRKFIKKRKTILLFYPKIQFYHRFIGAGFKEAQRGMSNVYQYVLNKTSKKFVLYKRKKYFLLDKIKLHQHRFSTYKSPRYKLSPQQYFFRKWKRNLLRDEIATRYSFFNNLKAPLLAKVIYGPVIYLLVRIIKIDLLRYFNIQLLPKFNFVVSFKFLDNLNLSASVILNYLIGRLDLLFLPREIIPKLLGRLFLRPSLQGLRSKRVTKKPLNRRRRTDLVKGIMFKCSGRFSRAQMASYQVYKKGRMPLSTIKYNIKYAFGTISLKYGSLGLKVFIFS